MLRARSVLPRSAPSRLALRWAAQVSIPVAATLLAAGLYAALPGVFVPSLRGASPEVGDATASLSERTSAGKFAARLPGVAASREWPVALSEDRVAGASRVLRLPRRPAPDMGHASLSGPTALEGPARVSEASSAALLPDAGGGILSRVLP